MTSTSSPDTADQVDREIEQTVEETDDAAVERSSGGSTFDRSDSGFTRCSNCRLVVRRTELEIHLAHAHDIGPRADRKSSKPKRGRGRS
jgi:hypothetical protein